MSTCNMIMLTCQKNVINMSDATYFFETNTKQVCCKKPADSEISIMTCEKILHVGRNMWAIIDFLKLFKGITIQ